METESPMIRQLGSDVEISRPGPGDQHSVEPGYLQPFAERLNGVVAVFVFFVKTDVGLNARPCTKVIQVSLQCPAAVDRKLPWSVCCRTQTATAHTGRRCVCAEGPSTARCGSGKNPE